MGSKKPNPAPNLDYARVNMPVSPNPPALTMEAEKPNWHPLATPILKPCLWEVLIHKKVEAMDEELFAAELNGYLTVGWEVITITETLIADRILKRAYLKRIVSNDSTENS